MIVSWVLIQPKYMIRRKESISQSKLAIQQAQTRMRLVMRECCHITPDEPSSYNDPNKFSDQSWTQEQQGSCFSGHYPARLEVGEK
jgi:hypothetical protein